MQKSILMVEDELGLQMGVSDFLESENYQVVSAETGTEGLEIARKNKFDLILLDVMLPGMDGITIAKTLREENCITPIIMLTAKNQLEDKLVGLRAGADDYMTKPFEISELLARIEVQIKRGELLKNAVKVENKNTDLIVDLQRGFVVVKGEERQLLTQEIKILDFFYRHQEEAVSRETLLKMVWNYEENSSTRTVDVHIARLRQKIGDTGDVPRYIQTIRGIGYKFIAP